VEVLGAVSPYTRGHPRARLSCKSGSQRLSAVSARDRTRSGLCTRLAPAGCCLFSKRRRKQSGLLAGKRGLGF